MDLNREVAEKVMGWRFDDEYDVWVGNEKEVLYHTDRWNPLKDLNQCLGPGGVVEKLDGRGYTFALDNHRQLIRGQWDASFHYQDLKQAGHGNAKTPNEAILKAALEAVKA
jgi:hypothetical protein